MPKKGRVNRTPNIGVENKAITKGSRKAVTSTKKIAKKAKKAAKNAIIHKIAKSYKVTATTGIDPERVKDAIREIVNLQISRAGAQESTNISKLLLPKIYGLKSTKVVRDILETPAKPSTIQGPTLYGCGGTGLPESGSTSSWFFPEEKRDEMRDSGLVYCWMTLVPCTFKQGGGSYCGRGINHEMEHAIPCTGQVITSLLAQNVNIKSDKPYRKHHVILFEIMKNLLPGIPNQKVKRYVYLIMRMIRRQQVIMGLPSISVANQKKCQLNLLRMKVDPDTLQVRVETNKDEVKNIMNDVDSSNKKGMVQKPGKPISFSPCGWCGIHNPESAFASKERLTKLYSTAGYSADKVPVAVQLAMDFKAKDNKPKQDILKKQCDLLCEIYNKIANEGLSHLVISASILVLSVIIETTYKELGVETLHMPELFKWVEKAKQILSDASELERLLGEGSDSSVYIIQKSQELGELSGNNVTRDYLNFADATIKDFATPSEVGIQVGGAGELDMELEGDDTRTSMFRKDMVPTTPQRQIVPDNVYDPRAGIPGTPQPAVQPQLNIDALIREMNTVFGNPGQTENIGVEENITLMFDHFESMNEDINTDFLSGVLVNLNKVEDYNVLENILRESENLNVDYDFDRDVDLDLDFDDLDDIEVDEQASLKRTNTTDVLDAISPGWEQDQTPMEESENQSSLKRANTMDVLNAFDQGESQTLPMEDSDTDSEYESGSESEKEFEMETDDAILTSESQMNSGYGGGKKKSKKTKKKNTKRKSKKKSKKRKKNTKRKSKMKSKRKKNTKRKSNKKNTKK